MCWNAWAETGIDREVFCPGGRLIAAVIVTRFIWIFPATYLPRALIPSLRRRDPYPPLAVPIVMSWAGMRGVVSLAAALALPDDFPGRDFILATTFAVILVTVLVQGATLAPLIRVLGLSGFVTATTEDIAGGGSPSPHGGGTTGRG